DPHRERDDDHHGELRSLEEAPDGQREVLFQRHHRDPAPSSRSAAMGSISKAFWAASRQADRAAAASSRGAIRNVMGSSGATLKRKADSVRARRNAPPRPRAIPRRTGIEPRTRSNRR